VNSTYPGMRNGKKYTYRTLMERCSTIAYFSTDRRTGDAMADFIRYGTATGKVSEKVCPHFGNMAMPIGDYYDVYLRKGRRRIWQ
jgi:hypothetical protein